jgi:aspartyl-tRNA synthetase
MADEIRNIGEDVIVRVKDESLKRLGRARLYLQQMMKKKGMALPPGVLKPHSPIWISDFGMFEPSEDGGDGISCVHHPFTAPHPDDLPKLEIMLKAIQEESNEEKKRALQAKLFKGLRAQHYDLVCDGIELGGGSIRIHSSDLQRRVFEDALGMSKAECETKFGHLLEALSLGAPPHGGFALGFDRYMAFLCGANSISDTLAFPKASMGTDPLTGAPCSLTSVEEGPLLSRFGLSALTK